MKKSLLIGCGYTLEHLARRLDNETFVVTTRSSEKIKKLQREGFSVAAVDIHNPDSWKLLESYAPFEVVVDSVPPTESLLENYPQWISFLGTLGMSKAIYLSSTSVTGIEDGSWVDEATPIHPTRLEGENRVNVEQMYGKTILNFCALRLPAIYGPGRGIAYALKEGRYTLVSDAARWTNRIHLFDLVETIHKAMITDDLPKALYVADDMPALQRDIVSYFCNTFELPWPAEMTLEEAKKKLHPSLLSNQRISNKLVKEKLGIKLCYPNYQTATN